jgi:hypothetical protein
MYTVELSVGPSVVILLYSKDVYILGNELFQLTAFSGTQVWPGCCNHVLKLRDSVLDLIF